MKLFRHNVMIVVMAAVAALFAAGCADDGGVDNRELDYGYVQFKLYKEASAPVSQPDAVSNDTRAVVDELDYLADACKIEIRLLSGSTTIAQTLTLNYADKESAEFGLRSDKLQLLAGEYQIVAFILYDAGDEPLYRGTTQNNTFEVVAGSQFTVNDNETTDASVAVTLREADEYMKDNYALKAIWEALDGPNWYYGGEAYNRGCNWDFNKSPDLWSDQPGVEVHSNGRVAKLVLSEFGISGHMPAAIGQLTELVELYLGTHNDTNSGTFDPMLDMSKSLEDRNRNRLEYNRQYLAATHPATQMSYPCALALKEHGLTSPAMALYEEGYSESEVIDRRTGRHLEIEPKDVIAGRFCNNLLSLPNDIGRLSKLEYLYIGNSPIGMLPDSIGLLKPCTLLEIYNCPNMHGLPATVKDMPALVQVNISCNSGSAATPGWTSDEVARAIEYFATGASKNIIQMLYARDNNLESVPASLGGMEHLGLLDLAYNKITGEVEAFGPNFAPEEVHFEHNRITGFKSVDYNGTRIFCSLDNLDSFSASYNNLTLVPDIFSSKTDYIMSGVEFAYNDITGFENGNNGKYQGINVSTLTLSGNRIKQFPACLAKSASQINYIIMSGNGMTGFEEGSFTPAKAENLANLISIDLTYNRPTELPDDFHAGNMPYLYGVDLSYNAFASFPWNPTDALSLTVYGLRGQRADDGSRCLREWPTEIYKHTGLRGLFLGSNDLRKIDDTISYMIYNLDISDNPNITFDASEICYYWQAGAFNLIYDKTQNIVNCPEMLE